MEILTLIGADLAPANDPSAIKGRTVVNREWLAAYLRYGRAKSLCLLVWDEAQKRGVPEGAPGGCESRFCEVQELPELLGSLEAPVFLHGDPTVQGPKAALRALSPGRAIPVTGITHTLSTHAITDALRWAPMERLDPCDAVVCTSRAAQEVLRRAWEHSSRVLGVPPPALMTPLIPLGVFPGDGGAPRSRPSGVPKDRPIVLVHGRITLLDKMDLVGLIERWPAVMARAKVRPCLVISGALSHSSTMDVYRERIRALGLGGDVLLRPNVSDAERSALLASAQIYCSPSDNLQETFGLSVLEAMDAGRPVVLSDWSGYRDLIEDGKEGFLVPTYWGPADGKWSAVSALIPSGLQALLVSQQIAVDLDRLVVRIAELLGDPDLRERMGRAGRTRVAEHYDWKHVIAAYDDLFCKQIEIARALGPVETGPAAPTRWELFGHFPSHPIGEETHLRVTPTGEAVLGGREHAYRYLGQPWNDRALGNLSFTNAPEGRPVADMLGHLAAGSRDREEAFAALLWMLKRGWLEVVHRPR
ncbi:MAG: glycosyltransferase family 4 protein [Deltaproteobacteria bacterium]|nr:glycosyltransferase family 4 protein [Deltaproteobacteria bacterium]